MFTPTPLLEVARVMNWMFNRLLPLVYFVLGAVFVMNGCTSKEDPAETLAVCGNHACGELVMVTADTSSEGFHYLNPSLSPDGTRVLFTADWTAIPADDKYNEDDFFTNYRQMVVIPLQRRFEPEKNLKAQGAELLRLRERFIPQFNEVGEFLNLVINYRKGDPIWLDDDNIIFRLQLSRGFRLFRAEISNLDRCELFPLYLEPLDRLSSGRLYQHFAPSLSPDGKWLAFTRSSCLIPDSLETCSQVSLMVLDMETAETNYGFDAVAFAVSDSCSRIERPNWSPDSRKIVFSAGLDMSGGRDWGTELYTIDFDTTGLAATGTVVLNNNLDRLTYTEYSEGDPIVGIFNTSPFYSHDGSEIFFVSTRRMPTTTHHDRNIWRIPADGSLDPEIFFFTRSDDVDATLNPDGSLLLSSQLGFPTEMLNLLEEEAYQRARQFSPQLTDLEMRIQASDERHKLEMFENVMSQIYVYRK